MKPGAAKKYWVGFDLGGTKMMASIFDAKFKVYATSRTKTRGQEGPEAVLQRLKQTIAQALQDGGLSVRNLGGIGIGCPGALDLDKGVILQAPNLGWKNLNLREILHKQFHCPVALVNDVDAGTYGEYRFGAAQGARCALGVFPGTGLGGGCVYEGRLLRSATGSCLEIGHLKVDPLGRLCGCGQRGCLETVASRLAISAEAAMAAYRGEAPQLLKLAGTDLKDIKSNVLAKAIRGGDKVVENIVRFAAQQLGVALASVVNLLAPDTVVLGGGLVEAMPGLFLKEVREAVRAHAMKAYTQKMKVVIAELGDDAGVRGAAAVVAEMVRGKK